MLLDAENEFKRYFYKRMLQYLIYNKHFNEVLNNGYFEDWIIDYDFFYALMDVSIKAYQNSSLEEEQIENLKYIVSNLRFQTSDKETIEEINELIIVLNSCTSENSFDYYINELIKRYGIVKSILIFFKIPLSEIINKVNSLICNDFVVMSTFLPEISNIVSYEYDKDDIISLKTIIQEVPIMFYQDGFLDQVETILNSVNDKRVKKDKRVIAKVITKIRNS